MATKENSYFAFKNNLWSFKSADEVVRKLYIRYQKVFNIDDINKNVSQNEEASLVINFWLLVKSASSRSKWLNIPHATNED